MLDLYDDLVLDNHLSSVMGTRRDRLSGHPFKVIQSDNKEHSEEGQAALEAPWFYEFLELAMDSLFYGHSLIEFSSDGTDITLQLIPRRHVIPEVGEVLSDAGDDKGLPYRGTPFMNTCIEVGRWKNLGMLNKAAAQVLYKKNADMAWSEYCEIFGMPIRVGETNARSQADVDRMETTPEGHGICILCSPQRWRADQVH